jgi:transposase
MPMERVAMRQAREIIHLKFSACVPTREIARRLGIAASTVRETLRRLESTGLNWLLPDDMTDGKLETALYHQLGNQTGPPAPRRTRLADGSSGVEAQARHAVDRLGRIYRREPRRLQLFPVLRTLSRLRIPAAGDDAADARARRAAFRRLCGRRRAGRHRSADRRNPPQPVACDGRPRGRPMAQIFVAVLGASSFTFARAGWTQALPDWIDAHVQAFEAIGGVPHLLVPDNTKTAVIKACLYDPQVNRTYAEMATHYGTAILPARPRRPRDKAKVEQAVLIVERWLLGRLRHRTFYSLAEVNAAIAELMRHLNEERPIRRLGVTRRQLLEEVDRPALKSLPVEPYVFCEWRACRVGIDYHVEADAHYYSVPHRFARAEVDARLTARTVEIFLKGDRIAAHMRAGGNHKHTTVPEHMPSSHRRYAGWTIERIRVDARLIGPATASLCELILEQRPHPEQGFRACLGIVRLAGPYGVERVEAAAERAIEIGARTYGQVNQRLADPSSTTIAIGVPRASAPRTQRRSCIPTSVVRAITIRRDDLAQTSDPRPAPRSWLARHGQGLHRDRRRR